jgi:hypothetical protein
VSFSACLSFRFYEILVSLLLEGFEGWDFGRGGIEGKGADENIVQ